MSIELQEFVESLSRYAFRQVDPHVGLYNHVQALRMLLVKAKERMADVDFSMDPDAKEKLESNLGLIEEHLNKNEKRLAELLDRIKQLEDEECYEANKENMPAASQPASTNASIVATASPAPQGLRHRGTKVPEWKVRPVEEGNRESSMRREHDEITGELVSMALRLKQNNLALHQLVKKDREIVDKAGTNIAGSTTKFDEQHRDLQKFTNQSWASTWRLLMLFAFVLITTIVLFFVIVVTSRR